MADLKRWSVTYTKHVNQKRKVYQDGFLELHALSNKLLLFDDCEKLLECKIMKKDESVSCGDSLTLNAFLVDVNSVEGAHESPPPLSSNSLGKGNGSRVERFKSQKLNLSPSHKVIRDFKKREILKYEAIQQSKSPETARSSVTEWEAMYTTHITQKAKKYHDGFLQLSVRGSLGRQAILMDATRNNLSSRFMKKDENIASGEAIKFDGYLVEIGESRGDDHVGHTSSTSKENGIIHGYKNSVCRNNTLLKATESIKAECQQNVASHISQDTAEPSAAEWQVLYTTQLTQKSKKYHDGFLQFVICGSRGRRAVLLDSTKTMLHSRFLRNEEVIETGLSMKFDAYLIDVGELERSHATNSTALGNICNIEKMENIPGKQSYLPSKRSPFKGAYLGNACLRKDAKSYSSNSKVDSIDSVGIVLQKKPLRDASQILSFLQKPRTEKITTSCQTENKLTPTEGLLVSNGADLALADDNQPLNLLSSALPDQSSENVDTTETILTSSNIRNQFTMDTLVGNSDQKLFTDIEADRGRDGGTATSMPSASAKCCTMDLNISDDLSSPTELDEYPSFDLGIF